LFGKLQTTSEINKYGIGLGLHICKKIIESFGGTILVQSKLNQGTTFKYELPIKPI
jgi:signal transduction histidine kinase